MTNVALTRTIAQLASDASIEINVPDIKDVEASRAFLPAGKKVYVSCPAKQTWEETERACRALTEAGFEPIPHVPVRLLPDRRTLARLLTRLVKNAQVKEVLLIAGDYPQAAGPYSCAADVLQSGMLREHGLQRVSFAGHPEGHPKVSLEEIRRAEREKALAAARLGLEVSYVSQFFFEAPPFLSWVSELRAAGAQARFVGGLAGPARVTALLRYALRCGVGPSIRALGARPTSLMRLVDYHGPEKLMRALAQARTEETSNLSGVHLFCFGGYLRTCEWLHRVTNGQFTLNGHDGFDPH